ncbi:sensor histidine kinase [Oligoflexaceae bacterium]|nr:sensor histidine kinase [Oligoflexaceae bacterium]
MFFKSIIFKVSLIASFSLLFSFSIQHLLNKDTLVSETTSRIQDDQLSLAQLIAREIDTDLKKRKENLKNNASLISEIVGDRSTPLRTWVKEQPYFERYFKEKLILINTDGSIVAARPLLDTKKELDFKNAEWFEKAKNSKGVIFSKPYLGRLNHQPMMLIATSIRNRSGETVGVLAAKIILNKTDLFGFVDTKKGTKNDSFLIFSRPDKVSLLDPERPPLMAIKSPGTNTFHDKAMAGFTGYGEATGPDGRAELAAVADINSVNWFVVVRVPKEIAFLPVKNLDSTMWRVFAIVAGIGILLISAALYLFFIPLKKASRLMHQMAEGEIELDKIPNALSDEVGDIVDSFNNLVGTIEKQRDRLKYEINVKNRFFSIIAHDLRGPFNGLVGMTEMMSEHSGSFSKEELVNFSAEVKTSGRTVFNLVENLLEWASIQMGGENISRKAYLLSNIAKEDLMVLKLQAQNKRISLIDNLGDETVFVDRNMIKTVIRNLVSNALKFTPNHGNIEVSSLIKDDMSVVTVSDTGIGLPEKLFESVFSVDKKTTTIGTNGEVGTGLGLPICKEMIDKNGGKIWVESESGLGTKFHFTLPLIN